MGSAGFLVGAQTGTIGAAQTGGTIMNVYRRNVLKSLSVIGAATLAGVPTGKIQAEGKMLMRKIPKTGEALPAVGLGSWQSFDITNDAVELAKAKEVLKRFTELGGRMIDSSPMYGASESVLGELAAQLNLHKQLFVATKVWTSGREAGIKQMNESMKKLKVEKLDLMQVHNLLDTDAHLATLRDWKKDGRVRYLGITHYNEGGHSALEKIIKTGAVDFVQVNYSIAEREAEARLLQSAADNSTAVIINRPFAKASLFIKVRGKNLPDWAAEFDCQSWAQFFLKYILAHPAVTCVIPATRNVKHVEDNMGAMVGKLPDQKTLTKMVEYMEKL
jgi:diketogulonate reductase-like aldo/keto reductase